jgi:hypothetical protein
MPSNLPPEEQAKVRPFDPLALDRTVIAVPLLKEMQDGLNLVAKVQKTYPTVSGSSSRRSSSKRIFGAARKAHERKSSRWLKALNKKR